LRLRRYLSAPPAGGENGLHLDAGAAQRTLPSPFSGDPDRAYQKFYTTVQSWQRLFSLSPILAGRPCSGTAAHRANGPQSPKKSTAPPNPLPCSAFVIYDRSTHYILWALTESIEPANSRRITTRTSTWHWMNSPTISSASPLKASPARPYKAHSLWPSFSTRNFRPAELPFFCFHTDAITGFESAVSPISV